MEIWGFWRENWGFGRTWAHLGGSGSHLCPPVPAGSWRGRGCRGTSDGERSTTRVRGHLGTPGHTWAHLGTAGGTKMGGNGENWVEIDGNLGLLERNLGIWAQLVERRRRDKINNWIVQLSKIIPDCGADSGKSGASKGGILSKACDYVRELRQSNQRLQETFKEAERLQMDNDLLRQQVRPACRDMAPPRKTPKPPRKSQKPPRKSAPKTPQNRRTAMAAGRG
uniref:Uncharacterized protein n=1 Tax=Geospiza parvula TaxID=87175 RepID=A0A8U8BYZ3_GEOPR